MQSACVLCFHDYLAKHKIKLVPLFFSFHSTTLTTRRRSLLLFLLLSLFPLLFAFRWGILFNSFSAGGAARNNEMCFATRRQAHIKFHPLAADDFSARALLDFPITVRDGGNILTTRLSSSSSSFSPRNSLLLRVFIISAKKSQLNQRDCWINCRGARRLTYLYTKKQGA